MASKLYNKDFKIKKNLKWIMILVLLGIIVASICAFVNVVSNKNSNNTNNLDNTHLNQANKVDTAISSDSAFAADTEGSGFIDYKIDVADYKYISNAFKESCDNTNSNADNAYKVEQAPANAFCQNGVQAYGLWDESAKKFTLYYDDQMESRKTQGVIYSVDLNPSNLKTVPSWYKDVNADMTSLVIDSTFANCSPKSTYAWFGIADLETSLPVSNLKNIQGINNLNWSNVEEASFTFVGVQPDSVNNEASVYDNNVVLNNLVNAYAMFAYSKFDDTYYSSFSNALSEKASNISFMFSNCNTLNSLDLTSANLQNIKYADRIFSNCSTLNNVKGFKEPSATSNMKSIVSATGMFANCSSLTSLDIPQMFKDANKSSNFIDMFNACQKLEYLNIEDWNTQNTQFTDDMLSNINLDNFTIITGPNWNKNINLVDCGIAQDTKFWSTDGYKALAQDIPGDSGQHTGFMCSKEPDTFKVVLKVKEGCDDYGRIDKINSASVSEYQIDVPAESGFVYDQQNKTIKIMDGSYKALANDPSPQYIYNFANWYLNNQVLTDNGTIDQTSIFEANFGCQVRTYEVKAKILQQDYGVCTLRDKDNNVVESLTLEYNTKCEGDESKRHISFVTGDKLMGSAHVEVSNDDFAFDKWTNFTSIITDNHEFIANLVNAHSNVITINALVNPSEAAGISSSTLTIPEGSTWRTEKSNIGENLIFEFEGKIVGTISIVSINEEYSFSNWGASEPGSIVIDNETFTAGFSPIGWSYELTFVSNSKYGKIDPNISKIKVPYESSYSVNNNNLVIKTFSGDVIATITASSLDEGYIFQNWTARENTLDGRQNDDNDSRIWGDTTFTANFVCVMTIEALADDTTVKARFDTSDAKNIAIKYSVDGTDWKEGIISNTTLTLATLSRGQKLYIYGTFYWYANSNNNVTFTVGNNDGNHPFNLKGRVMALINGYVEDADYDPNEEEGCFSKLFSGCTNLKSISDNFLLSNNVVSKCYYHMFENCTGLTTVSKGLLPATDFGKSTDLPATSCYDGMFSGCVNLTSAPDLPSENIVQSCYEGMFSGCQNLTSAPDLPSENIASACYKDMFKGCKKLIKAPNLPAKYTGRDSEISVCPSSYESMFYECESLVNPPEISLLDTDSSICNSMFYKCTSLISMPMLHASHVYYKAYESMFRDCISLQNVADLPAKTIGDYSYCSMFEGCTSLKTTPNISATSLSNSAMISMFYGCTNLTKTCDLLCTKPQPYCYKNMYYGCSSLEEGPHIYLERPDWSTATEECCRYMFSGCTNLKSLKVDWDDWKLGGECKDPTLGWVNGVNTSGTFYCKHGLYNWKRGGNYIPQNWIQSEMDVNTVYIWVEADEHISVDKPGLYAPRDSSFRGPSMQKEIIDDNHVKLKFNKDQFYDEINIQLEEGYIINESENFDDHTITIDTNKITLTSLKNPLCFEVEDDGSGIDKTTDINFSLPGGYWYGGSIYYKTNAWDGWSRISVDTGSGKPEKICNIGTGPGSPKKMYINTWGQQSIWGNFNFSSTTSEDSAKFSVKGYLKSLEKDENTEQVTFAGIFKNCTGLVDASKLDFSDGESYKEMFCGCNSLKHVPDLHFVPDPSSATCTVTCESMFEGCTSLETMPKIKIEDCKVCSDLRNWGRPFAKMFKDCKSLKTAFDIEGLSWGDKEASMFQSMFEGCESLVKAPSVRPIGESFYGQYMFDSMFKNCKSLTELPEIPNCKIDETTTYASSDYAKEMFAGCTSLTTAENLVLHWASNNSFLGMFRGCTALKTPPKRLGVYYDLHYPGNHGYSEMFSGCSSLEKSPLINEQQGMGCFYKMFENCTSLKEITVDFRSWNEKSYSQIPTDSWVEGVPAGGKFISFNADLPLKYEGTTYIPQGWEARSNSVKVNFEVQGPGTLSKDSVYVPKDSLWLNDDESGDLIFALDGGSVFERIQCDVMPGYDTYTFGEWYDSQGKISGQITNECTIYIKVDNIFGINTNDSTKVNANLNCRLTSNFPNLKIKHNDSGWKTYTLKNGMNNLGEISDSDKIWLKADNKNGFSLDDKNYISFDFANQESDNDDNEIKITGNLSSLVLNENFGPGTTIPGNYCFYRMFADIDNKLDLSDMSSANQNLSPYCFASLFENCSNITKTANMLNNISAPGCCQYMYKNCKNLKDATNINITTTAYRSCYYMFSDCDNLVDMPTLSAYIMAESCYESMFSNCVKMTKSPKLPGATLAKACYLGMFHNCENLLDVDNLNAFTMKESCYASMFEGCTKLIAAPNFPSTIITADYCFSNMFSWCTNLIYVPANMNTCNNNNKCNSYEYMFDHCSSLQKSPKITVDDLSDAAEMFNCMFMHCKKLNNVTLFIKNGELGETNFKNWLYDCSPTGTIRLTNYISQRGASYVPYDWELISDYTTVTFSCDATGTLSKKTVTDVPIGSTFVCTNNNFIITYPDKTTITITFTPSEGYVLDKWLDKNNNPVTSGQFSGAEYKFKATGKVAQISKLNTSNINPQLEKSNYQLLNTSLWKKD